VFFFNVVFLLNSLFLHKCSDVTDIVLILYVVCACFVLHNNCFEGKWPPYAAHLTFEIAQDRTNGHKYVRIIYNDEVIPPPSLKIADIDIRAADNDELVSAAAIDVSATAHLQHEQYSEWMPYSAFESMLKSNALSEEQYREAVSKGGVLSNQNNDESATLE
jgi:hypothetical protein